MRKGVAVKRLSGTLKVLRQYGQWIMASNPEVKEDLCTAIECIEDAISTLKGESTGSVLEEEDDDFQTN